jgi:energy-coupling factor transport system ATP-binding protein
MNDPIICIQHLSYTYAAREAVAVRRPALVDISLEVARNSCAAFIGVTGSGKSTLLQHINGLLRPGPGRVLVDGIDIGAPQADLQELRRRVGMLFQFPEAQLFEPTVFADVAFGPRHLPLTRREVRTRVLEALDLVGMPAGEYARRSPFALSGGQRRRVALAGVLAMRPQILVLDEPAVGLDAEGRAEFYRYIQALRGRGVTLLLVSHDMAEVAALADRLFVLYQGRLVLQGTPRALFARPQALQDVGLAAPPLYQLLQHLRQRGLAVPEELTTVEEVAHFFVQQRLCQQ